MNKNAEHDQTYLGSEVYAQGESVFKVANVTLQPQADTEKNGLPTFGATLNGITDENPYFYLDFTATHTVVWKYDCNTTGIGIYPAGSCANAPTNMQTGFDNFGLKEIGVF